MPKAFTANKFEKKCQEEYEYTGEAKCSFPSQQGETATCAGRCFFIEYPTLFPRPPLNRQVRGDQSGDHARRYFREKAEGLEELMDDVLFIQLQAGKLDPAQQKELAALIQTKHDDWVEAGKPKSQKSGSKRTGGSGAAAGGAAGPSTAESPQKLEPPKKPRAAVQ